MMREPDSEMTEAIEFHGHRLAIHPFHMHLRAWARKTNACSPGV